MQMQTLGSQCDWLSPNNCVLQLWAKVSASFLKWHLPGILLQQPNKHLRHSVSHVAGITGPCHLPQLPIFNLSLPSVALAGSILISFLSAGVLSWKAALNLSCIGGTQPPYPCQNSSQTSCSSSQHLRVPHEHSCSQNITCPLHLSLFSHACWHSSGLRVVGDLSSFLSWGQGVSCLLILLHAPHGSLVMQLTYCFCVQIWKSLRSSHPLQLLFFFFPPESSDSFQESGCLPWLFVFATGHRWTGREWEPATYRLCTLGCVYLG